jgi:hypothetical protein
MNENQIVQQELQKPELAKPSSAKYKGEVVYIYAFDIAHELKRRPMLELLGQPTALFVMDTNKRNPRQIYSYTPQMVRLPALERIGPHGPIRMYQTIKLFPVGAISITARIPFSVDQISDLVSYHDIKFATGTLQEEVTKLAELVRQELSPICVRPVSQLGDEEAYTVFCIESPVLDKNGRKISTLEWHQEHRREIAALLTQELDIDHLSRQEATESTAKFLSYYDHDLVVIDWDAALIVDTPKNFDEILYLMELANLQLAELEAYDRILDAALERAYRDLSVPNSGSKRKKLQELRELRIDLTRFSDELSNITKFFGDWHLARIYQTIASRFHLADWHAAIDTKLKTLDGLYNMLQQDRTNQWMMILESTIVLLFIIDLIILIIGLK